MCCFVFLRVEFGLSFTQIQSSPICLDVMLPKGTSFERLSNVYRITSVFCVSICFNFN